ncbi:MAG TPA: nucleotide exchange factor GrpE [Bacteroidales bacterium]|nr:MAG: heat shock protein GrpE [Bacteroidetes bacterium ADurb.Bin217]HOS83919.1 nucleotide exchange factor GrpE [Bacteroidales bacterium]HPH15743.1 nucleotide exchange factor GrpE [Bacteroidales bacterium]HPM12281.1 nucleotide exchange factor GrpE [Bacteroidales bacterium]
MVKKKKHTDEELEQQSDESTVENQQETSVKEQEIQEQIEESSEGSQTNSIEKELADLQDKHIRLHAEFDNFRRRTLKEKADLIKSGGEKTILELLPVIDDLELAHKSIQSAQDLQSVIEGVSIIINKFQQFLKQQGVSEIIAQDQMFDTDIHEAITKFPAPTEEMKGKVIDVVKKGYQLHDKVIRFAQVVVGV